MTLQLYSWAFIPENWKEVHTKPVQWLFPAALFVIAKNWAQLTCPTIGGWLNKLCSINVMESEEVNYSYINNFDWSPGHNAEWK